ncbi:MAG: sulfatase [Verrucomicrobiota bacterium]
MRYRLLIVFLLSAVPLRLCADSEVEATKPNIVLFLIDDLGWMDLGCQGSDYYQTPNIDRLAESGVRFTNAYASCAVCSPTRASILTGKYPARLLLTQWLPDGRWSPQKHRMRPGRFLRSLPLEEITLAEALRESGYKTLHIGKWHLGGEPFSMPRHHGFDINIAGADHGAPGSFFFPYKGKWTVPTTNIDVQKQTLKDGVEGEYLPDRLTDEAISLIKKNKESPFFLYFPYYAVHTPLQAKKEKIERYAEVPKSQRQGNPAYAAMVESVDENIGRIMKALDDLALTKNTIVVFTSDNGGFAKATDNSPLRANKGSHYEGGIRVPLIIKGPGTNETGKVCDLPVISNDLYPTLLELADLPLRPNQHVDGISLAPLLRDGKSLNRTKLFWHYPHYNQHPENTPVSIIRDGNWKLIEFLESSETELYDLARDIGETKNLVNKKPKITKRLRDQLYAWKKETGAEPMTPNPDYKAP